MRILLTSYRFPPDTVGGVERYTQSLAAELVKAGHTVTVVARRTESGKPRIRLDCERLQDGTLLYRVVGPDIRFDRFLEHHERFDQLFAMGLLRARPEIVHINHIMGFSPRIVSLSHQFGAAVVLSLHDFYFACPRIHLRKPSGELCLGPNFGKECASTCFGPLLSTSNTVWELRAKYLARTLVAAEAVVAYSEYVASYFRKLHAKSKPIQIIPNGVPPDLAQDRAFRSDANQSGVLKIAYCGTVTAHKGPHVILEALRIAQLKSVNVVLFGHAPEQDYAKRLRDQAATVPGLSLKLYGKYERNEIPLLLRGVDCVIAPSLVPEAGPIVPREALACGVPVVAAKLGALPEVICEGENGFTFDPAHPAQLAAILRQLAADASLLARLRAGARRSQASTLAEHAEEVSKVYDQALQDFEGKHFNPQEARELRILHETLVRLGCDSSRTQQPS